MTLWYTLCKWWQAVLGKASTDAWTFIAISRRNSTMPSQTVVYTNLGRFVEEAHFPMCLFNESSFLSAIEVNYPVLISPMMLYARAMRGRDIQRLYLQSIGDMNTRNGPRISEETLEAKRVPVEKKDFSMRTVLLAPPIVTQKRRHSTAECRHSSSTKFIDLQHAQVLSSVCAYPYACSNTVLEEKKRTLACNGKAYGEGESSFGLEYSKFQGDFVITDFLFSLTENPFLFRGNATPVPRGSFIDSRTETVNIILVFYSPNEGIITRLTINAGIDGRHPDLHGTTAMVRYEMVHHVVVEGMGVIRCVVIMVLVFINLVCIVVLLLSRDVRELLEDLTQPDVGNEKKKEVTLDKEKEKGNRDRPSTLRRVKSFLTDQRPRKTLRQVFWESEQNVSPEMRDRIGKVLVDITTIFTAGLFVILDVFMVVTSAGLMTLNDAPSR